MGERDGEGRGMTKARGARIGLGRGARGTKDAEARSWVGRMSGVGGARVRRMVRLTIGGVCDDSLVGDARDEEASGDA